MKPSGGQYRPEMGDSGSLSRGGGQHMNTILTTAPGGHPVYLTQHQSLSAAQHAAFVSQSSGSSPHGPRDYHPHQLAHRGHAPGPAGIGINPGHVPMHMPQRRRTSGHRLSLLWDIGVAGERERDRAESSTNSILSHSYTTTASGSSHVIPGPVVYGGRPNMTMMSSLGGLQASQRNLASSSVASQPPPGTSPRHSASAGQLARPSTSLHSYAGGSSPFMLPGPSSIKTEPGTYVKEESSKSPMHSVTPHYPQMIHTQSLSGHPTIRTSSQSDQELDKETENMPSKECLLQSMDKVDKEINKIGSEIKALERKKQHLETTAKKPPQAEKSASPKKVETKHKDLWQVIYAENKRKAESARSVLDHLCQRYDMPLYNQPSDTKVYQDNLKKNEEMRPKLLAYFQRRSQLSNIRERYLCARYDQLMSEWQRRADRVENSVKRKTKEAKVRDFFEKQFPEIRKQREQQERFSRSGTRSDACRSDADFNEIVDGLSEQENQEQHMRQLAVVPPMLLDRDERRLEFINNNGLVNEPMEDYKERQELDHWSAQEKQIFKEKYMQHPKTFHLIASFLEKKSVNDCVLFYYLSKKSAGYKALVRKNSLKPRKVKSGRGHTQQSSASSGSVQYMNKNGQQLDKAVGDKDSEQTGDSIEGIIKEEEIERIDRPPSPRITRSRNKNMNWTDEDISIAKEGFGKHGKDFAAISRLFSNKSEHQIKNFYHNYKKKHNLDQLISDGRRKKPEGGRRTRTQGQNSESSSVTPPADETSVDELARPKSTEPSDQAEPSKKRKKEPDAEKKEEQKAESSKKVESTATSAVETEAFSGPPRMTSLASQIRTRRSAGVSNSNVESVKVVAKRSSESLAVEEPAEKKPRKSKSMKDSKAENREPTLEEQKMTQSEPTGKETENTELEIKKEDTISTPAEKPTEEPENPSAPLSSTSTSAAISTITSTENASVMSIAVPDQMVPVPAPPQSEMPSCSQSEMPSASTPALVQVTIPKTSQVKALEKPKEPLLQAVLPPRASSSVCENDGDSSATCSADEEPNLQDVESKVTARKHTDSPYAFEDESSASIKLESSRAPMPPLPSAPTQRMKEPLPAKTPPAYYGRPASTHPPQLVIVKQQDQKRPQSLPPPPGAIGLGTVPISALSFQQYPFQKQSTSSHIVGKVPDALDVRLALQNVQLRPIFNTTAIASEPHSKPKKTTAADQCHTIDLTVAPSNAQDSSDFIKEQVQRLPHYHPVPQEALSLQKDFSARKNDAVTREDFPPAHHREYTQSDIASMRERSAAIPVSSLRAPMPSSSQRKEIPRQEQAIKKEFTTVTPEMIAASKHFLIQPGQQPVFAYNPALVGRPHLTTSSVSTKIISGSMTSGAPLRQSQPASSKSGPPVQTEARRLEIITSAQSRNPSDSARYQRSPNSETTPAVRTYQDVSKVPPLIPRSSIVNVVGGVPVSVGPTVVVPDDRKGKSGPGSITTGLPVHRSHDERGEHRTAVIAGKEVVVKQPYPRASTHPDASRLHEVERHPHGLCFPVRNVPHPGLMQGMPQKSLQGAGSILDGRPVVKRKASDESNSSLSPSTNPNAGIVVSRRSPNVVPTAPRQPERRTPVASDRNSEMLGGLYPVYQQIFAEKAVKEEQFHAHRRTPEKLLREPIARTHSPSLRQTPTSVLLQHPAVKQEISGSPHSAEEMLRVQHSMQLPYIDFHRAVAGPLGLSQIPLTAPGVSQDFLEILRQYNRPTAPSQLLPMYMTPTGQPAPYMGGFLSPFNPAASLAPGSPQNDDGREATQKMINQDFQTARLMSQLRQPAQVTIQDTLGFMSAGSPAFSAPGIGPSPLVVSAPNPYHHLAPPYGLPVDRVSFIPAHHAFSPQFAQQSGRNSAESNRSPSHRLARPISPEAAHRRHRSGEAPVEFTNHPVIKERNSPNSPYHSPRSNLSPQRYITQAPTHSQSSPTHLSQLYSKPPYRHYPHSSTPPIQPSHHQRQMTASPRLPPGVLHPYSGQDILAGRMHECHPSAHLKHSRSGSLDGATHSRFERSRPDSASPHPWSLPQSPNSTHEHQPKYTPHIRHVQSPTYRQEAKPEPQLVQVPAHEQKHQSVVEERPTVHRQSPHPSHKHPADHGEARLQQQPIRVGNIHQIPTAIPPHRQERSPYPPPQQKERVEPPLPRDHGHAKTEPKHTQRHGMPSQITQISSDPARDLKTSGRTKIKAATFIDHLININYTQVKSPESSERTHKTPQTQKTTAPPTQLLSGLSHSSCSALKHKRGQDETQASKWEAAPSKPAGFESEDKVVGTPGYPSQVFSLDSFTQTAAGAQQVSQQPKDKKSPLDAHGSHVTFAKHSADVIDQCYRSTRETVPVRRGSPVRTASPLLHKPTTMVTEPISPPEKRSAPGRSEPKQLPPQTVYSHFQQQQRMPPSSSEVVMRNMRPEVPPAEASRNFVLPVGPQQLGHAGVPGLGGSLEDIIRKALMNGDRSASQSPELQRNRDKLEGYPVDMFITQAMMAAARPGPHGRATPSVPKPAPGVEERKGTPPTAQSQTGSEKYMSALMFRTPCQNITPPASTSDRQQQMFFQHQARPTNVTTSQSPVPQEPNPSQSRPAMLPMPQYEALSDSD